MAIHQESISRRQTVKDSIVRHGGLEHWHHRIELALVLEGSYRIRIGKQEYHCLPGDLAVIRSGQIHAFRNGLGCRIRICTFDPAALYSILPEPRFPKSHISAQALAEAGLTENVSRILDDILRERTEEPPLYEAVMLTQFLRLYTLLLRHFEDRTPQGQPPGQFRQFQAALEYIENHYNENITLSHVAEAISYNPTYVSTLFVSCSGVNFKTYLDNFRIKKAVDLLRSTDDTVTSIAAQCGYDNVRTFNNTFRRITGQSPSQLRKSF